MPRGDAPPGYATPRSSRAFGLTAATTLYVLAVCIFFTRWWHVETTPVLPGRALSLIDLARHPPAPRPATPSIIIPHRVVTPITKPATLAPQTPMSSTTVSTPAAEATPPASPKPDTPAPSASTTAKPAPPQPAAAPASAGTARNWEGEVLARLYKFRRYPASSRQRHEEGLPLIRFVIDRDGRVLSSRLERSSGFPALDREAVSLPSRSQPLPPPPSEREGTTIELVVPVEFTLN